MPMNSAEESRKRDETRHAPDPYNLTTSYTHAYNIDTNNKGDTMSITITYNNTDTPVLAKDVAPTKAARTILDNTIAQAKTRRTHQAWTIMPMANGTSRLISVRIQ